MMDKWADYLISKVSYDSDHLISVAIRHQDTDKGITTGQPVDRLTIYSDIINGLFYITIYSGKESWKKGHKIQTFSIGGNPYIRIDKNKVKLDYLGDLSEASIVKSEYIKELEFKPESIPEPSSSTRGSLPKGFTKELHQEPESIPEPSSSTRGSLPKGFQEPESIPEPSSSTRGSLPKGFTKELHQEPESIPELKEEEATPQEIAQLDDLEQQINELEKEIKKSKFTHIKRKIIKPLQKQNKKLRSSITTKKGVLKSNSTLIYCAKCKTKRKIKNLKKTTMKNGRPAVKGFCSICNCKVFRAGKIKKR